MMKNNPHRFSMKEENLFYATTFHGLEDLLKTEIVSAGGKPVYFEKGIVTFNATLANVIHLNYTSRVANKFDLILARRDRCTTFDELYKITVDIPWHEIFSQKMTFAVESSLTCSVLDHSVFSSQKTKDAIVDRFVREVGKRPDVERKQPDVYVDVRIVRNELTIGLNLSGERLFKRGYRNQAGEAPVKETLAAGIAKMALEENMGKYKKIIDPMCGSGTILIEAAMQILKIPSGRNRSKYPFMNLLFYKKDGEQLFNKIRTSAHSESVNKSGHVFWGYDIDNVVLGKAKENAGHMGLTERIQFMKQDFFKPTQDMTNSLIMFNPPYGERLKSGDDMNEFYACIGDSMKQNCGGSKVFIFAEFWEAIKNIGLRPKRRIELFNGKIECRLLEFDIF